MKPDFVIFLLLLFSFVLALMFCVVSEVFFFSLDYMTTRATVVFLIVFSWPSMFQACGGGMTSGILSGQIIGSFVMLAGVVLFALFLAYFLMVVTLGTSYRRINVSVLFACVENEFH
tara:strand:+ start:198 stop:548 length:351 start_codon:yes stop_codon:yes gene_type:complete